METFLLPAGLAVFVAGHGLAARPGGQSGGVLQKVIVALTGLAGIVLIVKGWDAAAAWGTLYTPPIWTRHITLALMLPSLILVIAAYAPAGLIKGVAKHPMLVGVKLWAFAHLVANGEVRALALFGVFLAYAVFARIAAKRRGEVGTPGPHRLGLGDGIALGAGAAAYYALAFHLHPVLFGVAVVG